MAWRLVVSVIAILTADAISCFAAEPPGNSDLSPLSKGGWL